MAFTNRFTGQGLQPSEVSYNALTIDGDTQLFWPAFADDKNVCANLVEVTSTALVVVSLFLPDATQAGLGSGTLLRNVGAAAVDIATFDGATVVTTLAPGEAKLVYLVEGATQTGAWGVVTIGAGASQIDLLAAAGAGLLALSGKLATVTRSVNESGSRAIVASDRSVLIVWTGGAGTFTLPQTATIGEFDFEVRNQGSGALNLSATGGENVDQSASISLGIGESVKVVAGQGAWHTVGRGRASQFNFTQLQKTVDGGTDVLTLTEAANVVQTYTGVLASDQTIVLPAVVQVYYVDNQTSGPFNLTFASAGGGSSVTLPTGQTAILFSDGQNIVNASTSVAGINSIVFAPGSAAAPSIGVGSGTTGIFSSGTNEVGVSSNGSQVAAFDAQGLRITAQTARASVAAATGAASLIIDRPAGNLGVVDINTGGLLRWRLGADGTAEVDPATGSNFVLNRYNNLGAYIDTPMTIRRSDGMVTLTTPWTFNAAVSVPTPTSPSHAASKAYADSIGNTAQATSFQVLAAHAGQIVRCTNAGAITATIPTVANGGAPVGSIITIMQYGGGSIQALAGAGVTLRITPGDGPYTSGQYRTITLYHAVLNEWVVSNGSP